MPDVDASRLARAKTYFENDLRDQQSWYSNKATHNKRWHTRLGVTIVAAGAATAVVQLFAERPDDGVSWVAIVTALLGALVVIAKGVERIYSFDETWVAYRDASENMKSERRLYLNAAGPYAACDSEDAAYRLFVERVEAVIAAERSSFAERVQHELDAAQKTTAPPPGSAGA